MKYGRKDNEIAARLRTAAPDFLKSKHADIPAHYNPDLPR